MSAKFFEELSLPAPHVHLGLGGGRHGEMTGRMLQAIESCLVETKPHWVIVYGDTNSTLAGVLAAAKLNIPVAHVEAGLRAFNRVMPEEINRIVADQLASILFVPSDAAAENLKREGIDDARIERVGDVMYDAALFYGPRARERRACLERYRLSEKRFALATVHRAENTDDPVRLRAITEGLVELAESMDVVVPLHPRTRRALEATGGLLSRLEDRAKVIEPLGYLDMLALEIAAGVILTDSGGVQKEAYFHGVPCVTLRDETEWTELVEVGANTLVGADSRAIAKAALDVIGTVVGEERLYGAGHAGDAIVAALERHHGKTDSA